MVSAYGVGLTLAPADCWVCGEDFVDSLAPDDEASPLAGVWEMDEEQEEVVHQDHLLTSAAGSGN